MLFIGDVSPNSSSCERRSFCAVLSDNRTRTEVQAFGLPDITFPTSFFSVMMAEGDGGAELTLEVFNSLATPLSSHSDDGASYNFSNP